MIFYLVTLNDMLSGKRELQSLAIGCLDQRLVISRQV